MATYRAKYSPCVVKIFNHLSAKIMAGNPRAEGGRLVLFNSGNHNAAKAVGAALIDRIGFAGIDLGSPAVGGKLVEFPGAAPIWHCQIKANRF